MPMKLKDCYKRFYNALEFQTCDELNRILIDLRDLIGAEQLIGSIMIKIGMAPDILYLLTNSFPKHYSLQENAHWVIINLTAGPTEDIVILVDQGCIPILVDCLHKHNERFRRVYCGLWLI